MHVVVLRWYRPSVLLFCGKRGAFLRLSRLTSDAAFQWTKGSFFVRAPVTLPGKWFPQSASTSCSLRAQMVLKTLFQTAQIPRAYSRDAVCFKPVEWIALLAGFPYLEREGAIRYELEVHKVPVVC